MDQKGGFRLTVIEAFEILDQFKQKIVEENYEMLVDEGEAEVKIGFEVLEALEVALYYFNSETEQPFTDPL